MSIDFEGPIQTKHCLFDQNPIDYEGVELAHYLSANLQLKGRQMDDIEDFDFDLEESKELKIVGRYLLFDFTWVQVEAKLME